MVPVHRDRDRIPSRREVPGAARVERNGARALRCRARSPRRQGMADITLEVFEKEARDFLDANAKKKEAEKAFVWGEGSDKVAMFEEKDRDTELADVAKACEWRGKKFDAGFGWITGPAEYGGRELPNAYERLWNSLEAQYQVPNQSA